MADRELQKLEQLQKVLELTNENYATTQEVAEVVADVLKAVETTTTELSGRIESASQAAEKGDAALATRIDQTDTKLDQTAQELRQQIATIELTPGEKGDPGEPGAPGEKGEPGERGQDGSPDTAEDIRNKLELLQDGEKLSIDAIEGLRKWVDTLPESERTTVIGANRALYQLLDVNIAGITNGQSIQWNGTQWVPYTPGGGGGGSGTVTSVSVTTANGVSGSVANPTTTPAITLSLGAITPTSVAATGTVTGSNLSGTNTGDQTITLTGDATGSGTGSFAVNVGKINGVALSGLATGILKNTTTTGVPSIAVAADFPTLNQSTTGNAATATALQTGRTIDGTTFDGTANITVIAPGTHAATSKATPVDADELPLSDSAASFVLKKLTWANLKATLKTYFDGIYQASGSYLTNITGLISAGTNVSITGSGTSGSPYVINASASGGITWTEITTTTQTAAVNNGYIANNASLVTITLPSTAAVGSIVEVAGKGAGGWKIAQNASGIIHFGIKDTTTGVGGSLASTAKYDSVRLVCIVANNEWVVLSSVGNITYV